MDIELYGRAMLSLVLVLGLIFGVGWAVRRFGGLAALERKPGQRRLGVVESLTLDPKHRLVLVRRDGVEHLLLLGAAHDLLVEGQIARPAGDAP